MKQEDFFDKVKIHSLKKGDILFFKVNRVLTESEQRMYEEWIENASKKLNAYLGFGVPIGVLDESMDIIVVRPDDEKDR